MTIRLGELRQEPMFFTASKRSFGQGNMFTPVCHSVHRGVWSQGVPGLGGAWSQGGGGPGSRRGAWWRPPPPGQLMLQAVRILHECIFVIKMFRSTIYNYNYITNLSFGLGFQTQWLHCTVQKMFTLHRL